ncbi:MAG: MauE/DoxX family redox-associated membrane protein [Candidatus Neomarinimicrobiota bacterium]
MIVRVLLGAVFLWASFDKIMDPSKFARDISNYHIIPFGLENIIAIILPWLEFFIGSGLILGLFVDGAVLLSGFLLIAFNVLIAQAMFRGFNIDCGCGLKEGQLVGVEKLLENFVFFGGAYLVYLRKTKFLELYPKSELSDK